MDRNLLVFSALRKGAFLEHFAALQDEQLRPFLPYLVHFCFKSEGSSTPELDTLRARLISLDICNDVLKYAKLDYSEIEANCSVEFAAKQHKLSEDEQKPFVLMEPMEKVLRICSHLIWTRESLSREQLHFLPFDIGRVHAGMLEECGWILVFLSLNCPEQFAISELTRQLLNYTLAPELITRIIMNQPDLLESVLDFLTLQLRQPVDEDSFVAVQTKKAINELFQLETRQAQRFIGAFLASDKGLRRTVQMLCSDNAADHFFVDSLVAQCSNRSSEFVTGLAKAANKPLVRTICQRLGRIMEKFRRGDITNVVESRVVLLISLLASCVTLRLTTEECRQWIAFLTRNTIADEVSLKISLATLLAAPNLMPDQISFRDEPIGRCLASFFQRLHLLVQKSEYSLLSNQMILIYVHLITDNAEDLAALLTSILGHKVPKTLSKQPFVKELYIANAINEEDVVRKAANISVTKRLNANIAGYLPVHCICAMLNWRSFSHYSTPIQEWVKAQLLECQAPVHPSMAQLLENFASSCVPTEMYLHFNQTIDERFFEEIFDGDIFDESRLVHRLLSLTFLAAFTYKLDVAPLQRDQLGTKRVPLAYSQRLWRSIPIRYLLVMADRRQADFHHIRPMLHRYMVMSTMYLLPEQMHFETFKSSLHHPSISTRDTVKPEAFRSALGQVITTRCFHRFSSMLDTLLGQSIQQQFHHYQTVLQAMGHHSLDRYWPRAVVDRLAVLWERFDSVVPRRLHEDTIKLWLSAPKAAQVPQLSERDNDYFTLNTPLILFRADQRVFHSPPHLRCFCRLLSFYLAASRDANYLRLAKAAACSTKSELAEKEELLRSLIGTQRLTVVQVFIELCDGDPKEMPELEEIRQILCTQIHQYFIADMHLPKLVHFNMYPIRLIPVIVRGVPSAHVLINSINELLSGGNLERRIFAVVLMTELLEQYKIPGAFAALTQISDLLDTLVSNIISEEFIILMLNILPSLERLILLSPFHAEHFLATLDRTRTLAQNRLALYTSYMVARVSPEQKLIDLIDRTLEDIPKLTVESINLYT